MSPVSWTGATASWGSTAELGPVVVRPPTVRSTSGPRSHSEANRVAVGVLEVTSRSIRPLPTRASELVQRFGGEQSRPGRAARPARTPPRWTPGRAHRRCRAGWSARPGCRRAARALAGARRSGARVWSVRAAPRPGYAGATRVSGSRVPPWPTSEVSGTSTENDESAGEPSRLQVAVEPAPSGRSRIASTESAPSWPPATQVSRAGVSAGSPRRLASAWSSGKRVSSSPAMIRVGAVILASRRCGPRLLQEGGQPRVGPAGLGHGQIALAQRGGEPTADRVAGRGLAGWILGRVSAAEQQRGPASA